MALSDLRIGTSLPGGHLNTLGGPVDPFYAQTDGAAWPSLAAACAAVPAAYRKTRTVNVLGQEYWWLEADLSDNGLVLKTAASSGGGSGGSGPGIPKLFAFDAPQAGAQSYALPAGAIALSYPVLAQSASSGVVKPLMHEHCHFSAGKVVFDAGAKIGAQDRINLAYYTSNGQPTTPPVPTTPPSFELYLTPDAPGNNADSLSWGTNPGATLQLVYNPAVQPDTSAGAAVMNVFLGGTDPATNQVGTLDYASADNGHQCGVQDTAANKLYYIMQVINADGSLGPQQAMNFYSGNILLVG